MASSEKNFLGDYTLSTPNFSGVEEVFKEFKTQKFKQLHERQKSEAVNETLFNFISKAPKPSFLLPAIIDYIGRVHHEGILEHYTFSTFELWLNQFSTLSSKDNYSLRGSIVGKFVPREEYQIAFPIGMGKTYGGSHFVTAHSSPDLDTTVASFWGWVDAFAARVAEGLHIWNLPGGPLESQIEIILLFNHLFGDHVFSALIKNRTTLAVSSIDLVSQKGVIKKQGNESAHRLDHERNQNAIILVDEWGYYLGDWRNIDVEGVRQVIMSLNSCLRWFENNLQVQLISLFGRPQLSLKDVPNFIHSILGLRIKEAEPAKELTQKQAQHCQDYLVKVLGVSKGMDSSFEEFAVAMKKLEIFDFKEFVSLVESLDHSELFDSQGLLIEDRPRIFNYLEKIITELNRAIHSIRNFVDQLGIALQIKTDVFGYLPQSVSSRADLEEIRSKMANYPYLTVTYPDAEGRLIPLGVVQASDLHKSILGTVSLRDFCNREETKIPSYLEIISVIDHHRSQLNTFSPPVALISDAQSSNVLVAEMAFTINDRYSTGGMSLKEIQAQMKEVEGKLNTPPAKRQMQRLLQRYLVAESKGEYFVDSNREFIEYLHFLYAILDDTDLLTKVTHRDVECVANLLNRLKSLMVKKEVEVISFDDIARDEHFVKKAAAHTLQNPEMYSLYRKIYLSKEETIQHNLELCIKKEPSPIFADTKEQNGCCRIGQSKLFASNFAYFFAHVEEVRTIWFEEAYHIQKEKNEIDLHLHMISTIAGAEDLFKGKEGHYEHKDEMWIWIPSTEQAIEHLKSFLNAFKSSPQVVDNALEVELTGENAKELEQIFIESFLPIPRKITSSKGLPIAILRYKAGSINSRKAMVSPYLPRLVG